MTRDGRFKREVRRAARASGEPYTSVRARLDEARGHRGPGPEDEPRWVVAYTFVGAEDWVRDWLASRHASALERVLVPRYGGEAIVPGMLLVEVAPGADVVGLLRLPQLTTYRGEPAPPERLTWEDVRQVLRAEAQKARRPDRTGPVMEDFRWLWGRYPRVRLVGGSRGEAEDRAAHRLLEQLERGTTDEERQDAKGTLLVAFDPLVRYVAELFVDSSALSRAELLEAGRHGLVQAIEQFSLSRGIGFRSFAYWWIRQAVVQRMAAPA